MAARSRVYANSCRGTLTATLSAAGTTLTSTDGNPGLSGLSGVLETETYAAITVAPPTSTSTAASEIVYAHTYATTGTVTVIRARESTTARAHATGTVWVHGPTKEDVGRARRDIPQAGSEVLFERYFEDFATGVPSGWAWDNQDTCTIETRGGAVVLTHPHDANTDLTGIYETATGLSTATSAQIDAKIGSTFETGTVNTGMWLRSSTGGQIAQIGWIASERQLMFQIWNSSASFNTTVATDTLHFHGPIMYWRAIKNSATSWDFQGSNDGYDYFTIEADYDLDAFMKADQVGFGTDHRAGQTGETALHWVRVIST